MVSKDSLSINRYLIIILFFSFGLTILGIMIEKYEKNKLEKFARIVWLLIFVFFEDAIKQKKGEKIHF